MKIVGLLAVFLLGGGAGFAGGYLFASKKKQKFADAQIADMERYFKKKYEEKAADEDADIMEGDFKEVEEEPTPAPATYDTTPKNTEDSLTRETKERTFRKTTHDYTQYYRGEAATMDDEEYNEDFALGLQANERVMESRGPTLISEREFGKDTSLKTMDLNYYQGNGVLTINGDIDEEVIDDFQEIEAMIGHKIIESGFADDNRDTLYVRNEKMGTDYMINKMFASYEDG